MVRQQDRLIEAAIRQLGKGEIGENNAGPFVEELHRGVRRRGNWCAAFVAWCFEETGICPLIPDRNRRGAKGLVKYLARELDTGEWVARPRWMRSAEHLKDPRRGDVITWHRGPSNSWKGHVELVEGYDSETDTLRTVAGNVGPYPAKVCRREFPGGKWRRRLYGIARLGVLHQSDRSDS